MKKTVLAVVLIVLTSVVACQTTSVSPTAEPAPSSVILETPAAPTQVSQPEATTAILETPVAPTPVAERPDVSWIFETPSDPIQLTVELDTAKTVEAVIPVAGGTLSVTGADGTVYTLDIPADALLEDTKIGMTPVSSLSGMPFGGEQTYAVQFSPDGLFLYQVAILTITPAKPIPVEEQIVFGYQAQGQDLILAAPVVTSSEIKIQVEHFSGNGATRGLLADIEPVRERLGGAAERRLSNAVSEALIRERQRAGNGAAVSDIFSEALAQYEEQVVKPRVAAAGESCAAGQLAVQTVLTLNRMRNLLGLPGANLLENYPGLLDKAGRKCVLEEFELCIQEHVIHRMVPVWLGFERQFQLLGEGDSSVLREARDLTVQCLTFKLKFESTGTLHAAESQYESTVNSEITLHFKPDEMKISGDATLVNEDFDFTLPNCDVTSVTGDGHFDVFDLIILSEPDDSYGHVTDFKMLYMPGGTSESASYVCDFPGGGHLSSALPAWPAWTSTFLATHADEMENASADGGGFKAVDWEIFGDEYFAKKEWIKEAGENVETGTFKLYHSPGG